VKRIIAIVPCLLVLAACTSEPSPRADNSGDAAASGEVLEGSISDAMLPLDTVVSQSRPLKQADKKK